MTEKKLGYIIGNLFYTYTNYLNNSLKEIDITLSQTRILLVLALNNGVSIDYLSEKTKIGKSSITKSVKILEKKELLTKEIDPKDNRKKIIKITEKGKTIQKLAIKNNDKIEEELNKELGETEINDLKKELTELTLIISKIKNTKVH